MKYSDIKLLPGQVVIKDPDGLLQAQKEEQPKKTAPRKAVKRWTLPLLKPFVVLLLARLIVAQLPRKVDSLSDCPCFGEVKR